MKSVKLNRNIFTLLCKPMVTYWYNPILTLWLEFSTVKVTNFELLHNRSLHGSIPMFYQIIYLFLHAFITS